MTEILLPFLLGFLGHKLEGPTRRWFSDDDTNRIASYTEGVAIIEACFAIITKNHLSKREWIIANGLLAICALTVGAGTVLGYIMDGLGNKR